MTLRTIIILMTLVTKSYGQVPLGTGIVKIEFDGKTILDFYDKPTDNTYSKRIEFFDDKSINSWNIRDLDKEKAWLKPEILWLDYSQFNFRCKATIYGWFEVIVNNENGKSLWLKHTKATKFLTWENYLKDMFGVSRLKNEKQIIRTTPSDSGQELNYDETDCFQVKALKGDWIEIFTGDHCDKYGSKKEIQSGWIKWRRGDKLLIEYFKTS